MWPTRQGAAFAALIGAACLAGCEPARTSKTEDIVVNSLAFGPSPPDLRVGDTVRWVNHDIFEHTATAKDGSFDVDLKPGATGQATLSRPGVIAYTCRFHPNMTGQIPVAP